MKKALIYGGVGLAAAAITFLFIKNKNDKKRAESEAKAIEAAKAAENSSGTNQGGTPSAITAPVGSTPIMPDNFGNTTQSGEYIPSPSSNADFGIVTTPVSSESLRVDREQNVTYGGGGSNGTGEVDYSLNKGYYDDIAVPAMPYDMTS